ncbi:tRNA 4-thiouridine(8) synthase ThiI [Candidatus Micrarchaeota archaeon]|nr:tRNA 4-thiouridine(8) synthase ThiI [Candidatus Micrarchaeota archaeon]
MIAIIHYGEIGLKGKNRRSFEEKLAANVRKALLPAKPEVKIEQKRVIAEGKFAESNVCEKLGKVFGIEWFAIAEECRPELESIWKCVKKNLKRVEGKTFAVKTRRSDKNFPMKSMELSGEIGGRIQEETGAGVDLDNPEATVWILVLQKKAFVYFEKLKGRGGLPVGVGGKVLCLMSGGIDSPVAAGMMMKRGCEVDFLHVHPFEKNAEVGGSKIEKLVRELDSWQHRKGKLLVVPYNRFYARTGEVERKYELVVFRRYLYKLAEKVALENGYGGIVSGDSLGQVASQTLENIGAAQHGLEIPVFRPLVSMDKMEIVDWAEKMGTYVESIKDYQDCCSLVAVNNPVTKAKKEIVEKYYGEMEGEKLVLESIGEMGEIE